LVISWHDYIANTILDFCSIYKSRILCISLHIIAPYVYEIEQVRIVL
jgi:hypothetical protein